MVRESSRDGIVVLFPTSRNHSPPKILRSSRESHTSNLQNWMTRSENTQILSPSNLDAEKAS